MKFLIKSYQIWLYPKILDLTLSSVPDGYMAGVVYGIYLLSDIDGQIISQHSISDRKRPKFPIFLKNIK